VLRALADQGVEHVFGYPGGAVLPIYDEVFQQDKVKHILVRHEQGATHAAEGYARSTGKPGVVLVTSGPGATNAVTGLTDALMDSIPLVCITGQVPTHLIGNDAFQECDTVGITRPCTKHNYLVKRVDDLARILHEAFYVATHGRPGPVVVDIPKDVQFAKGRYVGPGNIEHKTYKPRMERRPAAHRPGRRTDGRRQAAAVLYRRRGDQFRPRSEPAACASLPAPPGSRHLDAHGAWRVSGVRSAVARHARHARHL
jgi:acetolactate synthase I/II/III large subunit